MSKHTARPRQRKRTSSAIAQRLLRMNLPHGTNADLSRQEATEALRRSARKDLSAADALEKDGSASAANRDNKRSTKP